MLTSLNFLLTLTIASTAYAQAGLLVSTRQGNVIGTLVNPNVRRFLGVPFAVAGRWEAPRLPQTRTKPFSATEFGDSCLQALNPGAVEFLKLFGVRDSDIFVKESEDCLTVNIWTPNVRRKQGTAVLLWVYGGGLQMGTSNFTTYNGENIVRDNDDILVVTFNYRLNIFGFPNAPQLLHETQIQNFGLLDLDAVVQWVYDNIAAFGGDPERIVLFGESAGGVAIDAYTFAHPRDTKVKGIIEQSGSLALAAGAPLDATSWNTVASLVGCGNVTDSSQLTCMKRVPFRTLEDAVISTNSIFSPVIDDITIFSDTAARSALGEFLHVPLLGGTTAHEGDIFIVGAQDVAAGVVIPSLTELLADLQTQLFTCAAGKTASDRVRAGVPTWRYQYQAIFPDISTRPDLRAYHASEIPIVFGTFAANPATHAEIIFSKFVQSAWVAFARDPHSGLSNIGWPAYSPNTTTLAQLGNFFNQTGAVFTEGQLLDFVCNFAPVFSSVNAQLTALLGSTGASTDSCD